MNFYSTFKHKLLAGAIICFASLTYAENLFLSFDDWKMQFYQKAANENISERQLANILSLTPYEKAIKSDKNQAEFKKFLWDYLSGALSKTRSTFAEQCHRTNGRCPANHHGDLGR